MWIINITIVILNIYFEYYRSSYLIKAFYVDVEHFYVNCSDNLVAGESPNVQIVDFHDSVVFRAEKICQVL